jgi:hypothetical protein
MALFDPDATEEKRREQHARRSRTEAVIRRTWAVLRQLRREKNTRRQE